MVKKIKKKKEKQKNENENSKSPTKSGGYQRNVKEYQAGYNVFYSFLGVYCSFYCCTTKLETQFYF